MVRPDRDTFRALARAGRPVPLLLEVLADLETPVGLFRKLDDGRTSFLFESAEESEDRGRLSFMGFGRRVRFVARAGVLEIERASGIERSELPWGPEGDPLSALRQLLDAERPVEIPGLPRFAGGAVGYLSYDWVRYVERLPDENPDDLEVPECHFTFPEVILEHDRKEQRLSIVFLTPALEPGASESSCDAAYAAGLAELERVLERLGKPAPPPGPSAAAFPPASEEAADEPETSSNVTRERYHEMVKRAKDYIEAGDVFQVVPSQRLTLPLRSDPFEIYRRLRVINPSPYLFFLRCEDHAVLGSSPEILVRLEGDEITLRPIAGTRPRGDSSTRDRELERELLADPKELAEHLMLVDLGRNDVGRVAKIGSVRVDEFHVVERYSHVMHIVSNVRGQLAPGQDAIDLLRATFPAGTLSGAPKVRAMEIIDELESTRRGLYGGAVGYLDFRGNMDICIAIRTMLIKDGKIHVQAGGGVVADSDPETEYQESFHKARALMRAVQQADRGSAP